MVITGIIYLFGEANMFVNMPRIIRPFIPLVVVVMLFVSLYTSGVDGGLPLTCTSPCQQSDASNVSRTALPPCTITPKCWILDNVPANQAPGGPLQVGIGSSPIIGSDGKVYLETSPHWQASPDRISLLTGYEVKVMCNRNVCASQYFCVTISFNRTLTVEDIQTNFSVSCQYGNFSQPGMDYVTMIRSLPKSNDDSNMGSRIVTLPSCKQVPTVSLCNIDSPEDWVPEYRPLISQINNGSVCVSFWPSRTYTGYHVILKELVPRGELRYPYSFPKYFDSERDGNPSVYFNNVPAGIYIALVCINETICPDCMLFRSSNNITVDAMPIPGPSTPPTTPWTYARPRDPGEASKPDHSASPLSLAALAGGLGGILGVILIMVLIHVAHTRKNRRPAPPPNSAGNERESDGEDLDRSTMLPQNNKQYGECDSLTGTGFINQWTPPFHSSSDYDSHLFGIDNPSMIPPMIHNDWKHTNGRLAQESEYYANSMGYCRGDSISKVAVDVHSALDHQTSSKSGLHSMEPPDSGIDSIYSEGTLDDGQTLFSLALTNLGEEV